jgi:hypothetical protein
MRGIGHGFSNGHDVVELNVYRIDVIQFCLVRIKQSITHPVVKVKQSWKVEDVTLSHKTSFVRAISPTVTTQVKAMSRMVVKIKPA